MHALALVRAAGSRLACASLPTPDQQPQPLHRYVVPPRAVERPAVVPRHTPAPTRTSGASPAVRLVLHYTGGPSTTDARAKTTNPTARSAAAGARPRRVRGTPSDSDGQAATPVTRPADTSPFSAPPPPPARGEPAPAGAPLPRRRPSTGSRPRECPPPWDDCSHFPPPPTRVRPPFSLRSRVPAAAAGNRDIGSSGL